MPCLAARRDLYRSSALSSIGADSTKVTEERLKAALNDAFSTVLSTRYAATDAVGVIFGIGFQGLFNSDKPERVKVVERDTGSTQKKYIVRKEVNRSSPNAVTGIAVRFRDSRSGLLRLAPGTVFGSIQLGIGEAPVQGVALGLGWPLVGDTQILLGWSLVRIDALRDDLDDTFRENKARMELPVGETEQSILGVRTPSSLLVALAVPVSLKTALGSR